MSTDKLTPSVPTGARAGYEAVRLGGYVWVVRNTFKRRDLLENPAELFVNPVYVRKPAVIRVEAHSLIVKRYYPKGFSERIKQVFRGPRARQASKWAARLQQLGVATITPVAAGHACCRPWESYLISEELQSIQSIQEFAAAQKFSLRRRTLLQQLATTMAVLHNHRISHRDAHHANFIVHSGNRVVLTDLDGLRKRCCVTTASAANDLKRLLDYSPGSQREHLRFLVTYARKRQPSIAPRSLISHLRSQHRGPGPLSRT